MTMKFNEKMKPEIEGKTIVKIIKLDSSEVKWIKKALSVEPECESDCMGEDETYSRTVVFDRHMSMDVKLCGVQYNPNASSNLPWTEAVLFRDGSEIACSEASDDFFGEWTLFDGKDRYTVVVEEENTDKGIADQKKRTRLEEKEYGVIKPKQDPKNAVYFWNDTNFTDHMSSPVSEEIIIMNTTDYLPEFQRAFQAIISSEYDSDCMEEEIGVHTWYFTAGKEALSILDTEYPEAAAASVMVEYVEKEKDDVPDDLDAFAFGLSPARKVDNSLEDYDWNDVDLPEGIKKDMVNRIRIAMNLEEI